MIKKRIYFIITWGALVSIISVGPFVRPHQVLNNSTIVAESNKAVGENYRIKSETNSVEKESDSAEQPEVINYIVKAGDTVGSISGLYGVSTKTVALSNGISENADLSQGQTLKFPSVDGILYKVNNSETLWDIAVAYKKDVDELIAVNLLQDPNKLKLNQEIIIPDADKLLVVKDNNLIAKAETKQKTLSRGGSISSVIKAFSTKVAWPLRGSITSPFGKRSRDNHPGIDIAAPTGTTIQAASDGRVIFAGWQDGYGKLLIIQGSSELQTYYAHTSEILVKVGQTVSSGQVVAKVGMTGETTGPHLHFEVRKKGNPVDPMNYLN